MPRNITVTFDDGSSHIYQNAPDDITPEQASARAQHDFGKTVTHLDGGRGGNPDNESVSDELGGLGLSITHGVPVLGGLVNKGIAGLSAAGSQAWDAVAPSSLHSDLNGSLSARYNQSLAHVNSEDQRYSVAHPNLNTAGQIVGGLATGLAIPVPGAGAGLLARAGLSAIENGAIGGADAFTRGSSPLDGAALGAGMGAGAGAVSHFGRSDILGSIARHLAGVGIGAAGGAAGASMEGADPLAGAMSGAATGAAGEAVGAAAKPLATGARAFEKTAGANFADRAFNARDVAAQKVAENFSNEGASAPTLQEKLAQMGPAATLVDVSPIARQAAGRIAAQPGRGQSLLRDFVQKREAASGQRVSDLISKTIGPAGDGDALISALIDERHQAAKPLYDASLPTPVTPSDELEAIAKTASFQKALPFAENLARDDGYSLKTKGEDGASRVDFGNMTLRDLHYAQMALRGMSEASPTATGVEKATAASAGGVRQRLLAQMDAMSPKYQQARKIYAGSSRVQDAYKEGFNAFDSSTGANHLTNDKMERNLADYDNQAERQAYLLGARQRMSNVFGSARNNRQKAYTVFGVGNDNPDFENQRKLATLLSYVQPAASQEAAQGAIQDDLRQRLGYSIEAPEQEPITPESVHGPENPLVDHHGNALSPESEEGQAEIARRITQAEAERQASANALAEQKQAALQFSGPDRARGQSAADALLQGLKAEHEFGLTTKEIVGGSETARRLLADGLVASSKIELPATIPATATKAVSSLANAVIGSTMRRRADAVNYEMAKLLIDSDPRLAAPAPPAGSGEKPPSNTVAAALLRNPGVRKRAETKNGIAQALLTAALTQANMNGSR